MSDRKKTLTVVIGIKRSSPKHQALMDEAHREADRLLAKDGFKILSMGEVTLDYRGELTAEEPR